ncbi:pectinesterase family protein [Hymenobacter sp. 5516J-16]|uniref:pectinesterase family protein n=1 Tax=Hymenobacter sp. 5516J-16 TaxID=2932253 RepID=UPI00293EC76E|nr:pectinesterase family protein [Hymenobacter sp. 5516J-16]
MKPVLLFFLLAWLTLGRAFGYDFVVAQDGSGQFRTVQEAFNAVPDFRKKVTTIFIKKGVYKEKLLLAGSKNLVTLIGRTARKPF